MCGIYGVIIPENMKFSPEIRSHYSTVFRKLAIANSSRGSDATGMFTVKKNGSIEVYKKPIPTWQMMFEKDWMKKSSFYPDTVALIGHARERSEKNWPNTEDDAHPHDIMNIVGVHNGTITNIKPMYENKYTSDSKCLFRFIQEKGIDKVSDLYGSMALCFVLKDNPFLFNFVSDGRPLHFIHEKGGIFVFSSEFGHLSSVQTSKGKKAYELCSATLLTINANAGNKKDFKEIPKTKSSSTITTSNSSYYNGATNSTSYNSQTAEKKCALCEGKVYSYNTSTVCLLFDEKMELLGQKCSSCNDKCDMCGKSRVYQYHNYMKDGIKLRFKEDDSNIFYLFKEKKENGLDKRFLCSGCFANYMNKNADKMDFKLKCEFCKEEKDCEMFLFQVNETGIKYVYCVCSDCVKNYYLNNSDSVRAAMKDIMAEIFSLAMIEKDKEDEISDADEKDNIDNVTEEKKETRIPITIGDLFPNG